jgi:hypothetical protein
MPLLARAYEAKEAFYRIWDATSRVEAEARYADWFKHLAPEVETAFAPLMTAMGNLEDEIFAYFSVPGAAVTNATTKALNGLAKLAQRMGRGYSFEAIRAKLLYGITPHKRAPTSLRSHFPATKLLQRSSPNRRNPAVKMPSASRLMADYGVAISTLEARLKSEAEVVKSTS